MTCKTSDSGLTMSGFSYCKESFSGFETQTSNNSSEFGNVLIYAIIYTILLHRIHGGYYTVEESKRVRAISNLMVVYPAVYVICTLPLASARMSAMTGETPSLARLCLAGAMIRVGGALCGRGVRLVSGVRKVRV